MNLNDQKDDTTDVQVSPWYTNFLLPAGLIFIIVLVGAGYFGYQSYSASKTPKLPTESPSNINYPQVSASGVNIGKSETTMNAEWYNDAYKTGNAALCEKITIEKDKKSCLDSIFEKEAWKNGMIATCDKISDQTRKDRCKDAIYYREATVSGNNEVCQKISTWSSMQQQCTSDATFVKIRSMATWALDIKFCDSLNDEEYKNYCVKEVNARNSYNAFVNAQSTGNTDACEWISDQSLKNSCFGQFAMKEAIKNNSIDACSKIEDNNTQSVCQREVEKNIDRSNYRKAIGSGDVANCQSLKNVQLQSDCQNNIYMSEAIKNKDQSLCAKITQVWQRAQCITFSSK